MLKKIKKKTKSIKTDYWTEQVEPDTAGKPRYTPEELRKINTQYLMRKDREKVEQQQVLDEAPDQVGKTVSGIGGGILTYMAGLGSACIAANPIILIIGGLIVIGSVLYGLSKLVS